MPSHYYIRVLILLLLHVSPHRCLRVLVRCGQSEQARSLYTLSLAAATRLQRGTSEYKLNTSNVPPANLATQVVGGGGGEGRTLEPADNLGGGKRRSAAGEWVREEDIR